LRYAFKSITATNITGKAIIEPNKEPQKVSYNPCNNAGIVIDKKYNDILYLGYNDAKEIK
jgi:hypothetical protein